MDHFTQAQYAFDFSVVNGNSEDMCSLRFTSGTMDDAAAFALAAAIKGLTWPRGTTVQLSLSKTNVDSMVYQADFNAAPASFI